MEPFAGSQEEQEQLAVFLSGGGGQEVQEEVINGRDVFSHPLHHVSRRARYKKEDG